VNGFAQFAVIYEGEAASLKWLLFQAMCGSLQMSQSSAFRPSISQFLTGHGVSHVPVNGCGLHLGGLSLH
jgi:hypothetical protein